MARSGMSHYFKRRWAEVRGDEYDSWGHSWWLFETDDEYWLIRQIEIYDNGRALLYGAHCQEDEFGGLSQAALDPAEFEEYRISREEFEGQWRRLGGAVGNGY